MLNSTNHLDNLVEEGYDFNFGDCINQGFRIVNKNIGGFIGFTLIYLATMTFLHFIPFIGTIGQLLIGTPLIAGFYIVAQKINNEEPYEFGDFFKGFDFFGPLVGTALITGLIISLISIPMGAITFFIAAVYTPILIDFYETVRFMSLLLIIPFIYLMTPYNWASMLVIFYGYSAWESMKMSRKLISKKWFLIFGYLIVIGLIAVAGMLLIGVGMLYTVPVFMCANYVVFHEVTKGEEFDDVIDHLIE
jgi:hypothetical protein